MPLVSITFPPQATTVDSIRLDCDVRGNRCIFSCHPAVRGDDADAEVGAAATFAGTLSSRHGFLTCVGNWAGPTAA